MALALRTGTPFTSGDRDIYRGRWIARIGRVTIGIAAMAVLWAILALIFGHPHDPIRGQISSGPIT